MFKNFLSQCLNKVVCLIDYEKDRCDFIVGSFADEF
jgi:hypothetical protein